MKIVLILISCFVLTITPVFVWAEDSNNVEEDPFATSEADMFSESETLEDVQEYQDEEIDDQIKKGSIGVSAELNGSAVYNSIREELKKPPYERNDSYSASIEGDLFLDLRWKYGMKIFGDVYAVHTPIKETGLKEEQKSQIDEKDYAVFARELFGDVNIAHKVYFRIGKQTLKWGQGYLWNPTDLINIDRKEFTDIEARREGSYGLKMHIPFGTALNIYTFINTTDTKNSDESALAGKVEFLVLGDIEMSVSGWTKKDYKPVYGLDIAAYGLGTYWRGELSLTQGGNQHYLEKQNDFYVDSYDSDEFISQLVMGFTRSFDIGDINDRFSLTGEFLYNPKGYEENMFEDITLKTQFLAGHYYVPSYYGKYYAAVFTTFRRFLGNTDLTFSANAINNLSDSSSLVMTNLNYVATFETSIKVGLSATIGEENREFTLLGNSNSANVSFSMVF